MMPLPSFDCLYCDRICPRCRYPISGGFEHIEQPQPEGASHVVCTLARVKRPVVEVLDAYLTHKRDHEWQMSPPIGALL